VTRGEGRGDTPSALRSALGRLPAMALTWLLMGLMLGLLAGRGSGPTGLAAALTAGALVMMPVGLVLTALGARWDESLAGGTLGMLLGLGAAYLAGRPDLRGAAALGLASGAFVGATALTLFYRLPRAAIRRPARREGLPAAR
jgi:hypothetical protein